MGKKKSNKQPLFIHFANCRFEKKELLRCFDEIPSYFPIPKNDGMLKGLKSIICDIVFSRCASPSEVFISEWVKPCYEKFLMEHEASSRSEHERELTEEEWMEEASKANDESRQRIREYIAKRISIKDWEEKFTYPIDLFWGGLIYMGCFHLELIDILKKITSGIKLEKKLLNDIQSNHGLLHEKCKFTLGKETYLQKAKRKLSVGGDWGGAMEFLEALIYNELAEFLCTSDWKKLKQCRECGKFFVAKVIREDIKFCSKECKRNNWNREYTKSGKHAEYMRKERPKKPHWIT